MLPKNECDLSIVGTEFKSCVGTDCKSAPAWVFDVLVKDYNLDESNAKENIFFIFKRFIEYYPYSGRKK